MQPQPELQVPTSGTQVVSSNSLTYSLSHRPHSGSTSTTTVYRLSAQPRIDCRCGLKTLRPPKLKLPSRLWRCIRSDLRARAPLTTPTPTPSPALSPTPSPTLSLSTPAQDQPRHRQAHDRRSPSRHQHSGARQALAGTGNRAQAGLGLGLFCFRARAAEPPTATDEVPFSLQNQLERGHLGHVLFQVFSHSLSLSLSLTLTDSASQLRHALNCVNTPHNDPVRLAKAVCTIFVTKTAGYKPKQPMQSEGCLWCTVDHDTLSKSALSLSRHRRECVVQALTELDNDSVTFLQDTTHARVFASQLISHWREYVGPAPAAPSALIGATEPFSAEFEY